MARQDILKEVEQTFGAVPGWIESFPDGQLEHAWAAVKFVIGDTKITARDKALVSFGAAAAVQCAY